ncbi:MAG: hypothetical protein WCJ30_01940 [Deltaproteobacteria bacterium]
MQPTRTILLGLVLAPVLACGRATPDDPRDAGSTEPARDSGAIPRDATATPADAGTRPVADSVPAAGDDEGLCTIPSHVVTASGWHLVGFRPGPAFRDVILLRRHRLAALTSRRLCTSDDDGLAWVERLAASDAHATLDVQTLDGRGGLLAVARTPDGDAARVSEAFVSHDGDGEQWTRVALPPSGRDAVRGVFADGLGRVYSVTTTQLFESDDDGAHWLGPRALPGHGASDVAACGPIVLARARVDDAWFYQRTFDRGVTWRPFRLGVLGLEGDRSVVRCITERGGIEAGRPPLATAWSWDGGLRWGPSGYDADAMRLARAAMEPGALPAGEATRCFAGPDRFVECVDTGRSRLVDTHGVTHSEVHAPSLCEHVRQVDARRTLAFGPGCGVFVSPDRGGRWRGQSQSPASPRVATFAEGRGGFLSADVAWRLDGGVWWTVDGGEHWEPYFSIHARALDRGVFVDRHDGVFALNNGWVVATHDGGRTFTFVMRGDVERIATTHRAVIVTTARSVRVSPDGGRTWLAGGTPPPSTPLDAAVEIVGHRRAIAIAPGVSVVQDDSSVRITGSEPPLVTGLPAGYQLVAAHGEAGRVDRVLLEGGTVLARD